MSGRRPVEEWLRRGIAACEKLVAQAKDDISRLSNDPDPAWARLERCLEEYTSGISERQAPGRVIRSLAACDAVVVGGLSTSPHAVELVGRLMARLPGCAVALNVPSCEHQVALDRFLEGKLATSRLAAELKFDRVAPEYVWPCWRRFLEAARKQAVPVVLYESDVHTDVAGRDDDALLLLDAALHTFPQRPLLVLAGELRASPASLVGGLQRLLGNVCVASVYCDLAGPYLRDLGTGGSGRGWFSLGPGRFCECRQSPLASLQTFLAWHAHDDVPVRGDRLGPAVAALVRQIARFLGLPCPPLPRCGVLGPGDPRVLSLAAASGRVDDGGLEFLAGRMAAGESRMIPEAELLYLGNLATSHVAEEAAHWLRSLTGGPGFCQDGEDAFWGVAVHELLAYFGSKVASPRRSPPGIADLAPGEEDRGEALAHVYGYNLAERLFSICRQPGVKEWIRAAFLQDLVVPGVAKRLYLSGLDLAARSSRSRKSVRKSPAGDPKGR